MPDVLPLSSSPVSPAERASRTPPLSAVLTAHAAPPASPLQTAGGEVVGRGGEFGHLLGFLANSVALQTAGTHGSHPFYCFKPPHPTSPDAKYAVSVAVRLNGEKKEPTKA